MQKRNNFSIGRISVLYENLNKLADRFGQGKSLKSTSARTFGEAAQKNQARIADIVARYKVPTVSPWRFCFSENLRRLENMMYYYRNSWYKTYYRTAKFMIEPQQSNEFLFNCLYNCNRINRSYLNHKSLNQSVHRARMRWPRTIQYSCYALEHATTLPDWDLIAYRTCQLLNKRSRWQSAELRVTRAINS